MAGGTANTAWSSTSKIDAFRSSPLDAIQSVLPVPKAPVDGYKSRVDKPTRRRILVAVEPTVQVHSNQQVIDLLDEQFPPVLGPGGLVENV